MQNKLRIILTFIIITILNSCQIKESEVVVPSQVNNKHDVKVQITTLDKEPDLISVLAKIGYTTSAPANARMGSYSDLDVDRIIKVLQKDGSPIYSIVLNDGVPLKSFSNLVLRKVQNGYLGYVLTYEAADRLYFDFRGKFDFDKFTGTLKRYDLEGKLLRTNEFKEGKDINTKFENARYATNSSDICHGSITYHPQECVAGGLPTESPEPNQGVGGCVWQEAYIEIVFNCDGVGGGSGDGSPIPGGSGDGGSGSSGGNGGSSGGGDSGSGSGDSGTGGGGSGSGGSSGSGDAGGDSEDVGIADPNIVRPTLSQLQQATYLSPFVLLDKYAPCEDVKKWLALAKFKVSPTIEQKVKNVVSITPIPMPVPYLPYNLIYVSSVLDIDNAYSSVVNMDYFSVRVTQLPVVNGQRLTPQQMLSRIRLDINNFVDQSVAKFTPYNYYGVDDRTLWNSDNPLGAIVSIRIPADPGSVIVSSYTPSSWIFSTIKDPKNGTHPVSGNREFGYITNADGSYTFYTRGVDRLTDVFGTIAQSATGIPFRDADDLWNSFKDKLAKFVNDNQGSAVKSSSDPMPFRPQWVRITDVMNGYSPISALSNDCK